jgi:hypothetical protein
MVAGAGLLAVQVKVPGDGGFRAGDPPLAITQCQELKRGFRWSWVLSALVSLAERVVRARRGRSGPRTAGRR